MKPQYVIQSTADGSPTIYLPQLDEHYHSIKGAVTESRYIYRDCALRHRARQDYDRPLRVLEVGFGTGLNAAVSAECKDISVHYIAFELYPLGPDISQRLGYDLPLIEAVNRAAWDTPVNITETFTLEKRQADFMTADLPHDIDIVYYDAFAPEKQPDIWERGTLQRTVDVMAPGGVLTTYCAKGSIRRMLTELGLKVERLPGPPGGKREILRATKPYTQS